MNGSLRLIEGKGSTTRHFTRTRQHTGVKASRNVSTINHRLIRHVTSHAVVTNGVRRFTDFGMLMFRTYKNRFLFRHRMVTRHQRHNLSRVRQSFLSFSTHDRVRRLVSQATGRRRVFNAVTSRRLHGRSPALLIIKSGQQGAISGRAIRHSSQTVGQHPVVTKVQDIHARSSTIRRIPARRISVLSFTIHLVYNETRRDTWSLHNRHVLRVYNGHYGRQITSNKRSSTSRVHAVVVRVTNGLIQRVVRRLRNFTRAFTRIVERMPITIRRRQSNTRERPNLLHRVTRTSRSHAFPIVAILSLCTRILAAGCCVRLRSLRPIQRSNGRVRLLDISSYKNRNLRRQLNLIRYGRRHYVQANNLSNNNTRSLSYCSTAIRMA